MKTLKFMLAAATAIGLASATQADQYNTTGFEKLAVGTNVTTGVKEDGVGSSYFYYAGANAEDNESVITNGTPDIARPRGAASVDAGREKILQVSTGTDPLLRTYEPMNGNTPQNPTTLSGDVYVDTLVQFTVTPYTDTVTPSNGVDKLMIYLKESVVTNEVGVIESASTNLVVVGGYYDDTTTAKEYGLNTGSITVEPNTWHRLTVKAVRDLSGSEQLQFPGFQIWVDGVLCTLADGALTYNDGNNDALDLFATFEFATDINDGKYVLSLLAAGGSQSATLQGVGFAGEGKVDDIVFSDLNPFATVFDFTFAFDTAEGVSSVTYTVGGTEYTQAKAFPEVESNTVVTITAIGYATGYEADAITPVGLTAAGENSWTVTSAGASLTVTAKEKQNTPLEPGQQDSTTYNTPEAAATAAGNVTIGVPSAVAAALTSAQQADYVALFEAKVVSDGAGGYKVEVGFTDTAAQDLRADATTNVAVSVAAQLSEIAADATGEQTNVSVTGATPGLYYSISYGTAVDAINTEGDRVMAPTTGELTLQTPAKASGATAGFYKVNINAVPKPVTP